MVRVTRTKVFAYAVAVACGYEVFAITTGLVPTISTLAYAYPVFGVGVLVGLAAHFWWRKR